MKKPSMANGSIVPHSVLEQQIKEAKEKELRKQQWRHDFRVALFSAVIGGFPGYCNHSDVTLASTVRVGFQVLHR